MKLNRPSLAIPGLVLCTWLVVGLIAVPAMLERTFDGSGLSLLSGALAAQPDLTPAFILGQWYGIVLAGTAAILFLAAFSQALRRPEFARRVVGEATPADLGAMRIVVCAVLLVSVVWEDVASTASLPREMIRPMGVMQALHLLPGFDAFIASESALRLFKGATVALLVLGMLGWKTRLVLPMGAVAYFIVGGLLRQYAWFYHTGLLALYLLAVLSVLPCHHGCSIDRLVRMWKGKSVPPSVATRRYAWMRYALWTTLAIPYVAAGLSKLRNGGLMWWEASNFKFILFQSVLRPMEFDFDGALLLTSAPDVVFEALAISAVAGEIFYGLVLFSRRARWIMPVTMGLMHVGILFFQNILFFDLIVLQCIFFNFRPLVTSLRGAIARRFEPLQVAYDGASPAHLRFVHLISALDVFHRLEIRPLDGPLRMQALSGGRSFSGHHAYRRIARALPLFWCVIPVFYLPMVGHWIERALARYEYNSAGLPVDAPLSAEIRFGWRTFIASPQMTVALVGLLCFFWVFRIEFYPFTGMQMFSKKRTEPVTYEKVFARLASGAVVRAPVEQCIGAMSDSRYRRVAEMAFDPDKYLLTAAFLQSCRERWNRGVRRPEERIESFEVQQWEWYYLADPEHPHYGGMTHRRLFPSGVDDRSGDVADTEPASTAASP